MDRRDLLRHLAASVVPIDLLLFRGDRVRPSQEILDYFDREVRKITEGFEKSPPAGVAFRARHELPAVKSMLLEGGCSGRDTVRLHRAAGRFGALRGAALADLGDTVGATNAFAVAFGHSHEAADRPAQAWVRCWQSALRRKAGDAHGAVALARDAGRIAGNGTPQSARAAVCEAWGQAVAGDRWAVHEAVGRAWRIVGGLEGAAHGTPGFSLDSLHTSDVGEMSASAYLELGKPDLAATYTAVVIMDLDLCGASFRQSRARVTTATALIGRDLDRAVSLVGEALDISADRPTARLTASIGTFLTDARRTVGNVRELDGLAERVRAWGVAA